MAESLALIPAIVERLFEGYNLKAAITLVLSALIGRYFYLRSKDDLGKLPLVNGKKWYQFTANKQRAAFVGSAKNIIDDALANVGGKFMIQTENDVELFLSADYAIGIKDNPALSFNAHVEQTPKGSVFHDAVKLNMVTDVARLNTPLSEEAANSLETYYGEDPEWHEIAHKEISFKIISQLSSRIFLGEELCRDQGWIQVQVDYTRRAMATALNIRQWPHFLRPLAYRLMPQCRELENDCKRSFDIINPVLSKRRLEVEERKQKGLEPKKYMDAMQWMEDAAKGRWYDPAASQMAFAIAANFTGADSLSNALLHICADQKLVEELRAEIIEVLGGEGGLNKQALTKMHLMDSVLKEQQRLKPIAVAVMRRVAVADTKLPDGTRIPKGTGLMVSMDKSWDPKIYPEPEKFDAYRFLRMRQAGDPMAQFVSVSPEALGFGIGKYVCPGRFFASNELKIVLSHILLKYDVKLNPDAPVATEFFGVNWAVNNASSILIRRRKEEINIL